MKIGVYVVNKETGHNDKTGKNWFKVVMVCVVAPELPVLIGKPLDKFVTEEAFNQFKVEPTKLVELEVDVRQAYKPEYADLHLSVNLIDDSNN